MKKLVLFLLFVVSAGLPCFVMAQHLGTPRQLTTTGGEQELAELIAKAPVIIEGRAEQGYCFWDADHREIYTATPITIYKVFKGEVSSSQVEVITYGGQVGNSASGCKDCNQVGLGNFPTGLFFLKYTPHPDPNSAIPKNQSFSVVDGRDGLLKYLGLGPDADQTFSRWQLYPNLEVSLYPAVIKQVGHPYQVVKLFDPKTYNIQQEAIVRYERANSTGAKQGAKSTAPSKKKVAFSTKGSTSLLLPGTQPQAITITSFAPSLITAGTFDSLTINGSGFGNPNPAFPFIKPIVQFRNADDNNQASFVNTPYLNVIRFNDTKIVVYVPSNDGSAPGFLGVSAASGLIKVTSSNGANTATSINSITIPRSELTLNYISPTRVTLAPEAYRQIRLINRDGSGGMRFKYAANVRDAIILPFPSPYSYVPPLKAIENAIRKWRCETTVNLGDDVMQSLPYSGDSTDCNVAFRSLGRAGNLMETRHKFSYCRSSNGTFVFTTAIDILINSDYRWSYDPSSNAIPTDSVRVDFKSAFLHELGHGIGLDHVADNTKLMYYSIAASEQRYVLNSEPELAGAANILRRSIVAGRCYAPMVALASTNCTGAQVAVTPSRFTFSQCGTYAFAATASGASTYKWYPAATFGNTNPTTATVNFSSISSAPYVYASQNGLGDFARVTYKYLGCAAGLTIRTTGNELAVEVYPNPTTTTFTVDFSTLSGNAPIDFVLYNAQGTVVYSHRWAGESAGVIRSFSLPQMPQGIYFLRTVAAGQVSEVRQLQVQ